MNRILTRKFREIAIAMPTKTIIGPRLQTSLEVQALKERILDQSDYVFNEIYNCPQDYGRLGFDNRILTYLSMFPDITVTTSDFNPQNLTRSGIGIELIEPRLFRDLNVFNYADFEIEWETYTALLHKSHEDAHVICVAQKKEILLLLSSQIPRNSTYGVDREGLVAARQVLGMGLSQVLEILRAWYLTSEGGAEHAASPFQGIGLEAVIAKRTGIPIHLVTSAHMEALLDKFDDFYSRLVTSLFFSLLQGEKLSVGRWWGLNKARKPSQLESDDTVHALQVLVQFKDELTVVPSPRSIAEAVDIGRSKEMARIRELVDNWLEHAGSNPNALEAKIRTDLSKASQELKRLKSYKEFAESPLVFGTKLLAGQVPVLSNIVSVIDAAGWAYERWNTKRNCWVAIK